MESETAGEPVQTQYQRIMCGTDVKTSSERARETDQVRLGENDAKPHN